MLLLHIYNEPCTAAGVGIYVFKESRRDAKEQNMKRFHAAPRAIGGDLFGAAE
jgi:hypothetical protein